MIEIIPTIQAVPTFTETPRPTIESTPTLTETVSITTTSTITATNLSTDTALIVNTPAPSATAISRQPTATVDNNEPEISTSEPSRAPTATTRATPTVRPTETKEPRQSQLKLRLQTVTDQLFQPIFVTHAGDGSERLFIAEQPGVIRIHQKGKLLEPFFLDIRERIGRFGSEQGFLGLAFSPNFASTGHFFVNYTDRDRHTVISRFQLMEEDPNLADPESELQLLRIEQPEPNHNGGMLLFGPDNYLYIGLGDGGGADDRFENGQNPATLLGKMLRIDVLSDPKKGYTIPRDNPWVNQRWQDQEVRDEIWAIGLRNPWRYSFDHKTGAMWIGDVGQNRYEEINYVPAGSRALNFGWPIMEGLHCHPSQEDCDPSGLTLPIAEYAHQGHCSVTGGYVYRGQQFPALDGTYLYGDFCSGAIWAIVKDNEQGWRNELILQTSTTISSFGEDEKGELYITDYSGRLLQVILRE